MSGEFWRDGPDPWGVFKKLVQKEFVRIFRSLIIAISVAISTVFSADCRPAAKESGKRSLARK